MYVAKSQISKPYLDTSLQMFQHLKDTTGMAATYNNIGVLMQRDLGRYQESIIAFEQALPLFQKLGNLEGMGSALNYMGLSYQFHGNFQKAIECLLQGMEVRRVGDMYQMLRNMKLL